MGFADFAKKMVKNAASIGKVSGSDFPLGTIINFKTEGGEKGMLFTYPNGEEYTVTRDKVKNANVLASVYGTKYKVELNDGKVAILTVGLGDTLYQIEHILF